MADIYSRVRFTGDASQLLATYKAIGAQAELLQKQINRVQAARAASLGFNTADRGLFTPGLAQAAKGLQLGPVFKNAKIELDAVNKVFRSIGETGIRTRAFGDVVTGTFNDILGPVAGAEKALTRYAGVEQRTAAIRRQAARNFVTSSRQIKAAVQSQVTALEQMIATGRNARGQFINVPAAQAALNTINAQTKAHIAGSAAAQDYANVQQRIARIRATYGDRVGNAIAGGTIPIPAEIQQLQRLSPALVNQLQKAGLATTGRGLFDQGATASFEKDLIRGTTRISGSFLGPNDVIQRFNAELDKSGKLITRFGGQLSGLQNFLAQTTRNFQKVVQWGVATTAVFGSIAFAARELSVLSELNKNLTRLSITANLSKAEADGLFSSLADIGIATATPLTEITASADDIALAVRETGKSTQDYVRDILNLTEAVGIYTNLTGTDTVEATDLLTSAMKQLGLQTEDVTGLLSKITAVAGGQSTAIADITEGLAAMAEAARNAGLSVDRTIATVQILSQVTAKSPSEIATAFKNLVGALENPAGIKQLQKLNIALVSEGNNIIDIYREIAEQIRTGAIGATEVSGILRNLAGGPRRAPDAAALLSNIDKIASSEARAIRASNEALIVNAKVLTTVQAKVTQLQSKFDKFAFEKFGPAFEQSIEGLVDALSSLLDFVSRLDTSFIAGIIQAGLFFGALRLGIGIGTSLINMFNNLRLSVLSLVPAYGAAAKAAQQFNQSGLVGPNGKPIGTPILGAGRLGGKTIGYGLGGAALGAGLSAAAGGDIKTILSGGLGGLGLGLLTIPSPEPFTKIAGAVALAASALVNFIPAAEDSSKAMELNAEKASALLQIYDKYSEADFNLKDLTEQQGNLRKSIATLNAEEDKTPEVLAQLADAQTQYVNNTIDMTTSTNQLHDAMKEIAAISPQLAQAIQGVRSGTIRPEQLEKEIQKVQLLLLQQTNPTAQLPEGGLIAPNTSAPITGYQSSLDALEAEIKKFNKGTGTSIEVFNLEQIESDASKVKQLFNGLGTEITATFQPTGQNIGIVAEAIAKLKASGDSLAPTLENTFNLWVQQHSLLDGLNIALASYQNRIDTLKLFKPEQAAELQKIKDLVEGIIRASIESGDSDTAGQAATALYDLLNGKADIDSGSILPLLRAFAEETGLLGDKALESADEMGILRDVAVRFGIDLEALGVKFEETGGKAAELSEEMIEAFESMDEFVRGAQENAATKSAEISAKIQSGGFEDDAAGLKAAQANLAALKEVAEEAAEVRDLYVDLATTLGSSLEPAMDSVKEGLTGINGLQDAQNLTTDQLIERLFTLAETYNLTGGEVDKLGGKLENLFKALQVISKYRAKINVGANVDVKALIKMYKALNKGVPMINPMTGFVTGFSGGGAYSGIISELESAQNTLSGFGGDIGGIYSGSSGGGSATPKGKGSKAGSGSKSKKSYDVSLLDLPEEIANAGNRDALIKEAIRRAKELQKQIPGAGKEARNDIVELLKGTQKILEVRGVKDDLLRKALEELAEIEKKRLEFETKADTIRRIRVGAGSFAAIANVPVNSRTGVSLGGPEGPINISLNLNGTVLTPAQFSQFADMVAAALKKQIAG